MSQINKSNIETIFAQKKINDPRGAAELAYVIAMTAKAAGKNKKAIRYGKESIELFDQVNVQSAEECAAKYVVVNGIALPELIHADVVRDRLKPLQL